MPKSIAAICAAQPAKVPGWKRTFDILLALVGLTLGAPLMLLIAALVKLTSPGPVFFSQERYGLNGKLFRILKFRKMGNHVSGGDRVTARHDFRMTKIGRLLERTKLDELPQLFNILNGEMSFVGPRPEDPVFADLYPEEFAKILSTPPGVAGPNQIRYRNESELYPEDCSDRGAYYAENILVKKIPVDMQYLDELGFVRDLMIFIGTFAITIYGVLSIGTIRRNPIFLAHIVGFPVLVTLSIFGAFALSLDFAAPCSEQSSFLILLGILVPIQSICYFLYRSHSIMVQYFNILDFGSLLKASGTATAIGLVVSLFVPFSETVRWALFLHFCLSVLLSALWFCILRWTAMWRRPAKTVLVEQFKFSTAYGFLGGAAWFVAYGPWFGSSGQPFSLNIFSIGTVVFLNTLIFHLSSGYDHVNRLNNIQSYFEILKIVVISSFAVNVFALIFNFDWGDQRAPMLIETVIMLTMAPGLKWALHLRRTLSANPAPRQLLVGTLGEVHAYFDKDVRAGNPGRPCGIVLVREFHQGKVIHAVPILGELAEARMISDQLEFDEIVALAKEHQRALKSQGLKSSLVKPLGDDVPMPFGVS